jgi:hypothetical protein
MPLQLQADKCGTFGTHFETSMQAIRKGERVLAPDLPLSFVSEKNHFKIHYTLSGSGAVDTTDKDRNGIPDYVDECAKAFEYAYTIQIDSMGFPPPPNNGENGTDPYDVYIIEFGGQGFYGMTSSIISLPGSNANHIYSLTYIEVDNNYSTKDKLGDGKPSFNTFGLDALYITATHEFQHAIHLANFGIHREQYDVSLYEMFATWMEFHHYPAIKDYHHYVKNYFLQPSENRFGQRFAYNKGTGYPNALFFEYVNDLSIERNLGFKPILDMWDNIGRRQLGYRALELALRDNGIPLHEIWCEYIDRVYHTGKRTKGRDLNSLFRDAAFFPYLNMDTATANPEAVFTGFVFPYEIQGLASAFSNVGLLKDTSHLLISPAYADWFSLFGGQDISFIVKTDQDANIDINLNSVPYCSLNKLAEGRLAISTDKPYPNPLVLSKHSKLCLPLPGSVGIGNEVDVKIFTVAGTPVHFFKAKAQIDEQNESKSPAAALVVTTEDITVLVPGVYIFTVFSKGTEISGKFAVKP